MTHDRGHSLTDLTSGFSIRIQAVYGIHNTSTYVHNRDYKMGVQCLYILNLEHPVYCNLHRVWLIMICVYATLTCKMHTSNFLWVNVTIITVMLIFVLRICQYYDPGWFVFWPTFWYKVLGTHVYFQYNINI